MRVTAVNEGSPVTGQAGQGRSARLLAEGPVDATGSCEPGGMKPS
jgi:hypothetical protein